MSAVAAALRLASEGKGDEAVQYLQDNVSADGLTLLGLWQIEGVRLPRDTEGARATLRHAA